MTNCSFFDFLPTSSNVNLQDGGESMGSLKDIHTLALAEIKKRFSLDPVRLKSRFRKPLKKNAGPGKSRRSGLQLGTVFPRGAYENRPAVLVCRCAPRSCVPALNSICRYSPGRYLLSPAQKRMVMIDIHRTGDEGQHDDNALFTGYDKYGTGIQSLLRVGRGPGRNSERFFTGSCAGTYYRSAG